ncbi:MAG TPA: NAD(P)-dependent oxidoreductase [Acetobacteraceae bacterium]
MPTEISTIAFVGLGTMGAPMARNLMRGGYGVVGFDTNPPALAAHVSAGGRAAASLIDAAADAQVAITMLPDSPDVERAILGDGGIIQGLRPGTVLIDMSSIDPATTRRIGEQLAARNIYMIDSPVGKTADHAVAGTLTLMVGGDPDIIRGVRPVLDRMGTDFFYCGPLGSGCAMKLTNNFLANILMAGSVEALVLGTKAGLSLDLMTRVMKTTMAWNNQLGVSLPKKALADDLSLGFMVRLAEKDQRLATQMAQGLDVKTPVADAALTTLREAVASGLGELDVSAVLRLREQQAGVRVRLPRE